MQSPALNEVPAESLSQAGAGGLLLSVSIVELPLGFWAAGWWQRSGALLVALIAAALLVRGFSVIAPCVRARVRARPGTASAPTTGRLLTKLVHDRARSGQIAKSVQAGR